MVNDIKKILVPIQFNKKNDNFLRIVAAIAKRHQAEITFINVVKSGTLGTGNVFSGKFHYHGSTMLANSENMLDKVKDKLKERYSVECNIHTAVGSVAGCITDYAKENNMDLIVLGVDYPKKRPGFISSNAYEIISNASTPVISVPFTCTKSKFQQMLFPVRNTEGVFSKLDTVMPIAVQNGAKVNILGIASDAKKDSKLPIENAAKFLKVKVAKQNLDCTVNSCAISSKPEEEILKACENTGADLVAVNVTTEKPLAKMFSNNFTENIIYNSRIPVLFYRKKEKKNELQEYIAAPYPVFPV